MPCRAYTPGLKARALCPPQVEAEGLGGVWSPVPPPTCTAQSRVSCSTVEQTQIACPSAASPCPRSP